MGFEARRLEEIYNSETIVVEKARRSYGIGLKPRKKAALLEIFFSAELMERHRLSRDYYRVRIVVTSENGARATAERVLVNSGTAAAELRIENAN